jgi:flagellar protein FliS
MYTNKSKSLKKYKQTEQSLYSEKNKSEVVSAILLQLQRSMNIVADTIEKTKDWKPLETDIKLKNSHYTKALTAIYSLQVSLNFDEGGQIAIQLFKLYEYCRTQLINGFSKKVVNGIKKAANAIKEIAEAWTKGVIDAKTS